MPLEFNSHRSNVLGLNGCVSCDQPLAANVGSDILQKGGNAADAAVAMAAMLAVTEPFSNGLGGDLFCLFYDKSNKQVKGINGSGRSPSKLTLQYVKNAGFSPKNPIPDTHGLAITVPAAPSAWFDVLEHFGSGKFSVAQLVEPAISCAEIGFPVPEIAAQLWNRLVPVLKQSRFGKELLIDGRAPKFGEIMKLPKMAKTLKLIATKGKCGFYEGATAEAIVSEVQNSGGVMELSDLLNHTNQLIEPVNVTYKGLRVWEIPPNTTGIASLMTLNILEGFDMKGQGHNTGNYLHLLIEAIKLSFADLFAYVADPGSMTVSVNSMISKSYGDQRRLEIDPYRARQVYLPGHLPVNGDTTYVTAVDHSGNACSFITSISGGFGSGVVPENCGFSLNNRGRFFSLDPDSPNVINGNKRSMNTIIPAMITDELTGDLLCSYGIMGGFMQPQAHVQVLLNMFEFGMDPQQALDAPRILVTPNNPGAEASSHVGPVSCETGIPSDVLSDLSHRGHDVRGPFTGLDRAALFGRGHIITRGAWWNRQEANPDVENDECVLWSASDSRSDGCSIAN